MNSIRAVITAWRNASHLDVALMVVIVQMIEEQEEGTNFGGGTLFDNGYANDIEHDNHRSQ